MPNYKEMYGKLFNKVTDVIEELRQVQRETEELYLRSEETKLSVVKPEKDEQMAE